MTPNQPLPRNNLPRPAAAPRPAAEIVQPIGVSEAATALLTPTQSIRQYLDVLIAAELVEDAIRVLAVGLPKPEAVWWACLCVRERLPKPLPEAGEKAIVAAEKWVLDSNDANRRAAGTAAETAGWDNAPGCVAGAAWLSGGSLSPPTLPTVSPREDLTGRSIAGALTLAAAIDPQTSAATLVQFLTLGQQIASGKVKKGQSG